MNKTGNRCNAVKDLPLGQGERERERVFIRNSFVGPLLLRPAPRSLLLSEGEYAKWSHTPWPPGPVRVGSQGEGGEGAKSQASTYQQEGSGRNICSRLSAPAWSDTPVSICLCLCASCQGLVAGQLLPKQHSTAERVRAFVYSLRKRRFHFLLEVASAFV